MLSLCCPHRLPFSLPLPYLLSLLQRLELMVNIIMVTFDMNQPTVAPMTTPNWNRCASTMLDILVRAGLVGWGSCRGRDLWLLACVPRS